MLLKFAGYGVFFGKINEIMKYATETTPGIIEISTQPEADAGIDDLRAITPLKQKTFVDASIAAIPAVPAASETIAGKIEIATQAEINAGTDDQRAVTPLKLLTNIAGKTFITIPFTFDQQNPPVNQTCPVGINTGGSLGITFGVERMYIPKAGIIRRVFGFWRAAGTAGSNENISLHIRLNDTTDTLVETIGDTSATKVFNKTDLAIIVAEGDYIEGKFVFPIWGTPPINVKFTGLIVIES